MDWLLGVRAGRPPYELGSLHQQDFFGVVDLR